MKISNAAPNQSYVFKNIIVFCLFNISCHLSAQTFTHNQDLTHSSGSFNLNTPTKHFDNLSVGINGGFYLGSNIGTGLPGSMGWQTIQNQTGGWFFRNSNRAML